MFEVFAHVNHSCRPNACHYMDPNPSPGAAGPPELLLRAVRDLQQGEEVVTSYIELAQTTLQRRSILRQHYQFECTCTRCGDTMPLPASTLPSQTAISDIAFQQAEDLFARAQDMSDISDSHLAVQQGGIRGHSHVSDEVQRAQPSIHTICCSFLTTPRILLAKKVFSCGERTPW